MPAQAPGSNVPRPGWLQPIGPMRVGDVDLDDGEVGGIVDLRRTNVLVDNHSAIVRGAQRAEKM